LDIIPQQTVDELQTDVSDVVTVLPGSIAKVTEGAGTFNDNGSNQKRQVVTGLEDVIAQTVAGDIPKLELATGLERVLSQVVGQDTL